MPKIVDHDAYRLHILEEVTPLFLRSGFEGLTTRQLARHLGISTGKLYHYFASKEELFAAVCRHWMERDFGFVRTTLESFSSPAERIRRIAYLLQEHRSKFDAQNQLLLQFSQIQQQRGENLQAFWEDLYASWEQLTRDLLELRSDFATKLMCQSIDAIFLQWMQGHPEVDLVEYFERMAHWLPIIDAGEVGR